MIDRQNDSRKIRTNSIDMAREMNSTSNYINYPVSLVKLGAHEIISNSVYLKFKENGLHQLNINTYALLSLINDTGQADSKFLGVTLNEDSAYIKQCTTTLEKKGLIERGDATFIKNRKYLTYKLTAMARALIIDVNGCMQEILSHNLFMRLRFAGINNLRLNYLAAIATIVDLGYASSAEVAEQNYSTNKTMNRILSVLTEVGVIIRAESTIYAGRNRNAFQISKNFNELVFGTLEEREKERALNAIPECIGLSKVNMRLSV